MAYSKIPCPGSPSQSGKHFSTVTAKHPTHYDARGIADVAKNEHVPKCRSWGSTAINGKHEWITAIIIVATITTIVEHAICLSEYLCSIIAKLLYDWL
jgi:hypothetical protein